MRFRSKRYRNLLAQTPGKTPQALDQAVKMVKDCASAKFTESVDLSIRLNIDTRKADQQIRGSFSLPHGTGRDVRIIVFADDGAVAEQCIANGAVKAGGEDLMNEVLGGFMDFDVAIATPKTMRLVGRLGRVLGPRGLMPSPKSGTVTEDVLRALGEFKAGKIEYRADSAGNVNVRVGNADFDADKLTENVSAMLRHITDSRPASVKGDFVTNITLSSTMGPGVRIAV